MNPRRRIINKIDKWFSDKIKQRDGKCLRCGRDYNLQCAHVFSRSHLGTRWEDKNAVTLCSGCHLFWAHKEPLQFYDWIRDRLGEKDFKWLRQKAEMTCKMTTKDLELFYKVFNTTR